MVLYQDKETFHLLGSSTSGSLYRILLDSYSKCFLPSIYLISIITIVLILILVFIQNFRLNIYMVSVV